MLWLEMGVSMLCLPYCLDTLPNIPLHLAINLRKSVLNKSVDNGVINQLFLSNFFLKQVCQLQLLFNLLNKKFSGTYINKAISFWEFWQPSSILFNSTHNDNSWVFWVFFDLILNFKVLQDHTRIYSLFILFPSISKKLFWYIYLACLMFNKYYWQWLFTCLFFIEWLTYQRIFMLIWIFSSLIAE